VAALRDLSRYRTLHGDDPDHGAPPRRLLRRPTAYDAKHPHHGDCGNCQLDDSHFWNGPAPTARIPRITFHNDGCMRAVATRPRGQLRALLRTGPHQGVTVCPHCHGPTVTTTFVTFTIVTTPSNHIPIGIPDSTARAVTHEPM